MLNSDTEQDMSNDVPQTETSRHPGSAERQVTSDIVFDGRYYRYKQYRYDLWSDAARYAQLDASRPAAAREPDVSPQWVEVDQPAEAERRTMTELGITFDGKFFRYGEYRYDHFADAINYAKLEREVRS